MRLWLYIAVMFSCTFAVLTERGDCVFELECPECLPENMPLVTSHRAANGSVRVRSGEEVSLSCGRGKFVSYPLRGAVTARCGAARLLVADQPVHLLDLGCQESVFEDVLHHVDGCTAPLQGRAYRVAAGERGARHLALLCFDADSGAAARAQLLAGPLPPHAEPAASPLSLFGNFNHMFDAKTRADAERLFGDDASTNRRLRELLKHEGHSFAGQQLTAGRLLAPQYFGDQDARVTDFASNKVPLWRSVAEGNLRHLQEDVGELAARAAAAAGTGLDVAGGAGLEVAAGTLETLSVRTAGGRVELWLRGGGRFPVPRYVWTVVWRGGRAAALVVLNDPFVAVSEVREAVFCSSACASLRWARRLAAARRYETPLYGLVFCCDAHALAARGARLPPGLLQRVPPGPAGLLTDL